MVKTKASRAYRLFLAVMAVLLAIGIWLLIVGLRMGPGIPPARHMLPDQGRQFTVVV